MHVIRPEQTEGQEPNKDQLAFPIETSPLPGAEHVVYIGKKAEQKKYFEADELATRAREAATTQLISLASYESHAVGAEQANVLRPDFTISQPELTGFSRALAPLTDALGVTGGGFRGRLIKRVNKMNNNARSASIPNISA